MIALSALEHVSPNDLRHQKCAGDVGIDDLLPALAGMAFGRRAPRQTSIVDQHIDLATLFERLLYRLFDRSCIRDIACQSVGGNGSFFQVLFSLGQPLLAPRGNHHLRARVAEGVRDFQAQSTRTAGDKYDFALEIKANGTHRCLLNNH